MERLSDRAIERLRSSGFPKVVWEPALTIVNHQSTIFNVSCVEQILWSSY